MRRAGLKRGHSQGFSLPSYFVQDIYTLPGAIPKTTQLIDVNGCT